MARLGARRQLFASQVRLIELSQRFSVPQTARLCPVHNYQSNSPGLFDRTAT